MNELISDDAWQRMKRSLEEEMGGSFFFSDNNDDEEPSQNDEPSDSRERLFPSGDGGRNWIPEGSPSDQDGNGNAQIWNLAQDDQQSAENKFDDDADMVSLPDLQPDTNMWLDSPPSRQDEYMNALVSDEYPKPGIEQDAYIEPAVRTDRYDVYMDRLFGRDTSPSVDLGNWTQQGSQNDQLENGDGTEENFNFDQQPTKNNVDDDRPLGYLAHTKFQGKNVDSDADMNPRPVHQREKRTGHFEPNRPLNYKLKRGAVDENTNMRESSSEEEDSPPLRKDEHSKTANDKRIETRQKQKTRDSPPLRKNKHSKTANDKRLETRETQETRVACGRNPNMRSDSPPRRQGQFIPKEVRSLVCDVCEKEFASMSSLNKHQKRHEEAEFECQVCHQECQTPYDLKVHLLTHTSAKPFHCDICTQVCSTQKLLRQHYKRSHTLPEADFSCKICHQWHKTYANLQRHKPMHDPKREFECNICKWRFDTKSNMKAHKMRHDIGT